MPNNNILRLGQKVMLPASNMNNQLVPYIVVGHEKGGVYHVQAESCFVLPSRRTIVRAKKSGAAKTTAA